ncbi:hypothetical protein DAPPUDRAFT_233242 [Daphnia pulex]|uniref:Uncharacterized protein n=1 Tax=Daphnia pulex TaxID=6669 RepID=E9FTL6_DAPPU|nr:hypothetical protein DAPPUDRAFT_233242 [Daphnia pulex]|eukprot:EFX89384.1 hypothetical protein DAPPUDRAFT_233242 [Daphnia pulex]
MTGESRRHHPASYCNNSTSKIQQRTVQFTMKARSPDHFQSLPACMYRCNHHGPPGPGGLRHPVLPARKKPKVGSECIHAERKTYTWITPRGI